MKRDEVCTWIVRALKMQNCIARILAFYSTITKIDSYNMLLFFFFFPGGISFVLINILCLVVK